MVPPFLEDSLAVSKWEELLLYRERAPRDSGRTNTEETKANMQNNVSTLLFLSHQESGLI